MIESTAAQFLTQAKVTSHDTEAGGWIPPALQEIASMVPHVALINLIGRGGMGAVYRGHQEHLDRSVAVKVVPAHIGCDPDLSQRFVREARTLAKLNHPGIVAVYDHGQSGDLLWMVMELVDGANLRQVMQTGQLSPKQALALVPPLCDALQYAHDHGVVHRDLKPENILLDQLGKPKIVDFGLAKLGDSDGLTRTGSILGSLHYMAPEQIAGAADVDHRADIYALGVLIYEMLTGTLPMGRFETPSQRVAVDVRIDEVVLRSLEREPDRRWQQASQVQQAVEAIRRVSAPVATTAPTNTAGAAAAVSPAIRGPTWLRAFKRHLTRQRRNRVLGGICGGLGANTPVPTWVWRISFLTVLFLQSYTTDLALVILLYIIAWLLTPLELSETRAGDLTN